MNTTESSRAQKPHERWSLKAHLNWKIAICYHPMYLVVDEDRGNPIIGERVPPWGAPTAEVYVKRVRRNLAALRRNSQLKLNYEWSACELESLTRRFPDVLHLMRRAYRKGQLDFVGGEYSQPHASALTSESSWQQYEQGLTVFRKLLGKRIVVHATQECHLQPQQPQLLRLFGYRYMVMPSFPWAVKITQGPFELMGHMNGTCLKKNDEFIFAEALDGTTIPAYFATDVRQTTANEEMIKDLWGRPPLWIDFPDMEEYLNRLEDMADPVILEQGLSERIKAAPPQAKGRLHTYWSYVEGVWAEEHLRHDRLAEKAVVLATSLMAMSRLAGTPLRGQNPLQEIWRTILKNQHHDIMWAEVTDLRRKAINEYKESVARCHHLMSEAAQRLVRENRHSLAIFNGLPRARQALLAVTADQIPGGGAKFQKYGDRYFGFRRIPAGGFASFPLAKAGWSESRKSALPKEISARHYHVRLSAEGLIHQITTARQTTLLADADYRGGEIRAVIGGKWVNNRSATCRFHEGDVCYVLERSASLAKIPVRERYYFFKQEPLIKVELEFDFDGNEVGDFHIDETKINVYYPTATAEIIHDVPFGFVSARENQPLLATHWVYSGGLVYVNRGTPKHWVRSGVLANTIAWGGRQFSNRVHWDWTKRSKKYDLRLFGKQTIEYSLIPFGPFDGARIVHAVEAVTTPVFLAPGQGKRSFYEVKDRSLVITSTYAKNGAVWARGYQLPSRTKGRFRSWEIFNVPLREIE